MEAALLIQPVTTPAQSDQTVRKAGLLLSDAFAYGDDCYERPEYEAAKALLMESAKFEATYNGRTVAAEYQIAYGLAWDIAHE
jgi:hypothetical protein